MRNQDVSVEQRHFLARKKLPKATVNALKQKARHHEDWQSLLEAAGRSHQRAAWDAAAIIAGCSRGWDEAGANTFG
jgi:hypothetical protein